MHTDYIDTLKVYDVSPGFQFKLSDIISSSALNFKVQSDSVMLAIRDGCIADIYYCDLDFTRVQKIKAIEGVFSLRDIQVKYQHSAPQVIIIYRIKNKITLYQGPSQAKSQIRSSQINKPNPVVQFNQIQEIMQISDINAHNDYGICCFITVASGRVYFLNYDSEKLTINDIDPPNKFYSLFKYIAKPLLKQANQIRKFGSYIYSPDKKQSLYTLFLQDNTLHMKYFDLSKQNNYQYLNSWQINLQDTLKKNINIIAWKFVKKQLNAQKHTVNLILICQIQGMKLYLYDLSIDFNTKINSLQLVKNLFNSRRVDQSDMSDMVPQNQHLFNRNAQYMEIQYFYNKIYIVYHRKTQEITDKGLISKRAHTLEIFMKNHQNKYVSDGPKNIYINGELKLLKLDQHKNKKNKLLFIGETNCYIFVQPSENLSQRSVSVRSELMLNRTTQKDYKHPPVPAQQKYIQQTVKNSNLRASMQEQYLLQQKSQQVVLQYQNPFSKNKLLKAVSQKNLIPLFKFLYHQKTKFEKSLKKSEQLDEVKIQQINQQFIINILLRLFTIKTNQTFQFNIQMTKQILTHKLQDKYKEENQYTKFLENLFIHKQDNKNNQMKDLIITILDQKKYRELYYIFAETIPNFCKFILQHYNCQKIQKNYSQMQSQQIQNKSIQKLTLLKENIIQKYLSLYQKYIYAVNYTDHKQYINQYEHKQILGAYLYIRSLLPIDENNKDLRNIKEFRKILLIYIQKPTAYGKYLNQMAIQHKSIQLLDMLVQNRLTTKIYMQKFAANNLSANDQKYLVGIFMNLVQVSVQKINNNTETSYNSKISSGLQSLYDIPAPYSQKVYKLLFMKYPQLAIIYGMTMKKRRQVADDINQVLCNKQTSLLVTIKTSQELNLFQPFYNATKYPQIKLLYDINKIYLINDPKHKFISYEDFINSPANRISLQEKQFNNFKNKIQKYLDSDDCNKVCSKFKY